jgi:hypothetical protein
VHPSYEWRIQSDIEDALEGLSRDRIGREVSDLPAAADETIDHLTLRGAIRPLEQLCQRCEPGGLTAPNPLAYASSVLRTVRRP